MYLKKREKMLKKWKREKMLKKWPWPYHVKECEEDVGEEEEREGEDDMLAPLKSINKSSLPFRDDTNDDTKSIRSVRTYASRYGH